MIHFNMKAKDVTQFEKYWFAYAWTKGRIRGQPEPSNQSISQKVNYKTTANPPRDIAKIPRILQWHSLERD
jgi:hypothetical protein